MRPDILLLDEPLSALDALTRAKLQEELETIRAHEGKTIVLVTNDVDEALLLADRIVPLTPGPRATLGPVFSVPLARPRDPAALTHDPVYKKLRADLTAYLMGQAKTRAAGGAIPLPRAVPVDRSGTVRVAPTAPDRYVEFSQVGKTFPTPNGPLTVVEGFDLKIAKGEFISLIGHSGCGKSTVLGMAAGLAEATEGGIILDGREITEPGPDRAVVFQSPSLFPWLTASGNVALGVDRAFPHLPAGKRRDIVHHYLDRVGLGDALDRPAASLSIGMRQRVGIARAFALNPKLLLLDEPFGMLDTLTRWDLQEVLMEVWARTRVTAICVTHDVDEAILLADRVVMMTGGPHARIGKILEVDIPRPRSRRALLDHPRYYDYREQVLAFLENHETGGARAGAAA
jgi:nitrate/nitrite transport system ATP-binding protein